MSERRPFVRVLAVAGLAAGGLVMSACEHGSAPTSTEVNPSISADANGATTRPTMTEGPGTLLNPTKAPKPAPTTTKPSTPSEGNVAYQTWNTVHNPDLANEIDREGEVLTEAFPGQVAELGVSGAQVGGDVLNMACVRTGGLVVYTVLDKGSLPTTRGDYWVRIRVPENEVCGYVSGDIDDTPLAGDPSWAAEGTDPGNKAARSTDLQDASLPLIDGQPA